MLGLSVRLLEANALADFAQMLDAGYEPSQVADAVADAIRADRFYVVPAQEYLLGNKAMYLFAFQNVRSAYSKDGTFPEAGPATTLKAIASFNPAVKPESINLSDTFTNEFAKKAYAKYGAKK